MIYFNNPFESSNWFYTITPKISYPTKMFEYVKDVIVVKCLVEMSFLIIYLTISWLLDRGTTKLPKDSSLYSDEDYEYYVAQYGTSRDQNYTNYNAEIYDLRSTVEKGNLGSQNSLRYGDSSHNKGLLGPNYKTNYGSGNLMQRYPPVFSNSVNNGEVTEM